MRAKIGILGLLFMLGIAAAAQDAQQLRRLPLRVFRDKMQGAWLGQMIGVGWGRPTEFTVNGAIMREDQMPPWLPNMVNQHDNDDCYVEMTFLKTLATHGFDVSIRQAGIDFANSSYPLWHANAAGRTNLRKGIAPPDSGHPQFNQCADDIDYQIESDFSGIIAPGLPTQVIALGEKFGRLMNYGDGRYAGQFIGGMLAEAYFECDVVKVIGAGLACIAADSQYAGMVRDLLEWHRDNPADWEKTWQRVEAKYHNDPKYTHGLCSQPGLAQPGRQLSIDAKLNGAYILMGLLYGQGDPDQTMRIACRCGQDSDCNAASAGGVFFAMLGASKIPARFVAKLDLQAKFSHTDYSVPKVYEVCEMLARQAVTRGGGRIGKDANGEEFFLIPVQVPNPGTAESCHEPGPIAHSKFTPEEMQQISARPPQAVPPP
jgi:hypothetical protein